MASNKNDARKQACNGNPRSTRISMKLDNKNKRCIRCCDAEKNESVGNITSNNNNNNNNNLQHLRRTATKGRNKEMLLLGETATPNATFTCRRLNS